MLRLGVNGRRLEAPTECLISRFVLMIRRHYAFPFSLIAGVFLGLCVGFGGEPALAQLDEPRDALHRHNAPDVGVSLTLREHTMPSGRGLAEQKRDDPPHPGRALVGSTIGVGLGGGFGVLLLKGADEANPEMTPTGTTMRRPRRPPRWR